jgi:hypothetical protein
VVERACAEGERDSQVGPDATNAWGVPASRARRVWWCTKRVAARWRARVAARRRVANLKDVLNAVLDRTACSIQGPLPLHRHLFPISRQAPVPHLSNLSSDVLSNTGTLLRQKQTRSARSTLRARALAEPIMGN